MGEVTFLRSATAESAREVHAAELGLRGAAVSLVHLHPDDAIPLRCVRDP